MKITKYIHSCLLVEMPAPVNRTALFNPGVFSEPALGIAKLEFLDDIIITHNHPDHMSIPLIKQLLAKFPSVRITTTAEAAKQLMAEGISATTVESPGISFFKSPHEYVGPGSPPPQQIGVHYLDLLTDPGDCHSFTETKAILALPVTAPWGSMVRAIDLGLELKPKYIIPIHDWHWNDEARAGAYDQMKSVFSEQGIEFIKPETAVPLVLHV